MVDVLCAEAQTPPLRSISETHRSKFGPVRTSSPEGPSEHDRMAVLLYLGEFRKRLCCLAARILLRMEAALLCPVAAGTRCEWRACLRHLGGGFFSHSSPSVHLRRYFFQVSFAPHFIRGPRCWASGRMQHIQGATFLTRTHRARSARSPHTYRRPFPSAIPPHSTRVCGQTGQGLRGWQRGRLRPVQIFRRGHSRGCRMRPCRLANGACIGLCMCLRLSIP